MYVSSTELCTEPLLCSPNTNLYVKFHSDLVWVKFLENVHLKTKWKNSLDGIRNVSHASFRSHPVSQLPAWAPAWRREVKLNRVVQVMEGTRENVEYNSLQTLIIIITCRRSTELPDRLNSHLPTEHFMLCVFLTCYIWERTAEEKKKKKSLQMSAKSWIIWLSCYLKSPETVFFFF